MSTLYEILEVSENASKEVIEKAYKVLAKKYHPDLQAAENKAAAEIKMKQINDAYDILSNEIKRKEYDAQLERKRQEEKQNQEEKIVYQSAAPNVNINNTSQNDNLSEEERRYRDIQRRRYEENLKKEQEKIKKQMEKNMQEEYENAYYNYLRGLGYKIKERWTWEKTKALIITLTIIILLGIILWYIPPTNKMMLDFYNSNKLIKIIIDIIISIISAFFGAIGKIFS